MLAEFLDLGHFKIANAKYLAKDLQKCMCILLLLIRLSIQNINEFLNDTEGFRQNTVREIFKD
jgi:hypothetical protein